MTSSQGYERSRFLAAAGQSSYYMIQLSSGHPKKNSNSAMPLSKVILVLLLN